MKSKCILGILCAELFTLLVIFAGESKGVATANALVPIRIGGRSLQR
jgi:hypothetical protein